MASPIGHSLFGIGAQLLIPSRQSKINYMGLLFVIFSANVPDLDFLPGLIIGDMNRYHHGISHSIGGAFIYALIVWFLGRFMDWNYWRLSLTAALAYCSHLIADYWAEDGGAPFGAPFLWPLSDQYYISPFPILKRFEHGEVGDGLVAIIKQLLLSVNFQAILLEIIIFVPMILIIIGVKKWRHR